MRYFLILLIFIAACQQKNKATGNSLKDKLNGNWFVLYPDDALLTEAQEKIYGQIQDSIVDLKCQKLITMGEDGDFYQLDSADKKGTWATKGTELVYINDGAKGFTDFKASFTSFEGDRLRLTEKVKVKGEELKFIWNLLRIDTGAAAELFTPQNNAWRKKPSASESDKQLKERVAGMLHFYSEYFNLISEKASYFIPARVLLPVNLYQHAIGLKGWDDATAFATFFYNKEDAKKGYAFLEKALDDSDFDSLPKSKSYTKEYADMLLEMAKTIGK